MEEIPLTDINFAAPTNDLIALFKNIKGDKATVPTERIDLIKSIINFYLISNVRALWMLASTEPWPGSKSKAVGELADILIDENCARNKATNKKTSDCE